MAPSIAQPPPASSSVYKLTGRRSPDHTVGLFLHNRIVYESERENRLTAIRGVVQTANEATVRVGVLAKVVGGPLGFGAAVMSGAAWMAGVMLEDLVDGASDDHGDHDHAQSVFARDAKQQANLPAGYTAFTILLPPLCLPTVTMNTACGGHSLPCLKWYVFVEDTSLRSRVYLSITRQFVADPLRGRSVCGAAGQSTRGTLKLTARLNSSCYLASGDAITVNMTIDNPSRMRVKGFKLTLKQLLTVTVSDQRDSRRAVTKTVKRNIARADYPIGGLTNNDIGGLTNNDNDNTKLDTLPLDIVLDPSRVSGYAFVDGKQLAPSFSNLTLPVGSNGKRLTCSLEYYINVHAVLPWSANLIVSLPFSVLFEPDVPSAGVGVGADVGAGAGVGAGADVGAGAPMDKSETVELVMSPLDNLTPLPFPQDIQQALDDMDAIESRRRDKHAPETTGASPHDTIAAFRAAAVSVILQEVDPLSAGRHSVLLKGTVCARRLVRHAGCVGRDAKGGKGWDAVRVLLTRCQRLDTLTMQRLDDAVGRVRSHLLNGV